MKRKLMLLLTCLFVGIGLATAQNSKVTGVVISEEDGQPVVGASVLVKGTTNGTITDIDGKFSLSNVPSSAKTLVVSYVGMKTQDVAIKPSLKIILQSDSQNLDEIVVVGYGTQKKKDLTSSIAKVGGEDIGNLATASFDNQLAGRAAGVQVISPSGVLGSTPTYRVRGLSTISSNDQPLIIIDGMPVVSGNMSEDLAYVSTNAMSDINPNDIESIEILKDGAATAIYGSRAANGVVLITTKKGSKGKASISYDGYVGVASAAKLHDLLNGEEFVTIANEKYSNWGEDGPAVYDGTNTNWNDYVFKSAFQQNHNLSASGGTEKSQYYFSVGYTNQDGIVRANDLERFTVKADLTQTANRWLKIGINAQGSRTKINGVMNEENSLGSVGFASVRMLPNVAVFNADDVTGYNIDAVNRKTLGRGSNLIPIDNGIQNIVWGLDNNINRSTSTRVIGGGFAEITFLPGFTLRTQGGLDMTKLTDYMYWNKESGDGYGYGGLVDETNVTYHNWNWQNVLNYNHTFNAMHNLSATAVQEYTYSRLEYTDASVEQLSDGFFADHIITNTFGEKSVYGDKTYNGLASYMLRANYNYDSKYYVGASIRWDGLSRLSKDERWGTFWGASAAWRISREHFWDGLRNVVNDLRIRASYATLGNSELGDNFPYLNTYGPKKYGSQNGIAWNNMGVESLSWETTETFDLGLDGGLFDGRLTFELAYWQKNSKDLVLEVPTAPSLGIPYNKYYDNIGKIKNSGIEITIGGDIVNNKDFRWHSDINFSTLKNKVLSLYGGSDIVTNYTVIREGESYNSLYGYDFYGVNKENGNPIWRKANGSLVQFDTFGDYDYKVYDPNNPSDVSEGSSLDATDRKVLGSALPKWFGGWNNTLTYKGFDLNVFFRFSGGNKIMNATRQASLLNLDFSNNGKEILGRWQSPENPGDGVIPKIGYGDSQVLFNDGFADSRFVENGSYLKLSTLALGYTFPANWVSKLSMQKIRLYVQGQNIFTITGYKGLDPETSTRMGVDWDGMPQQRVFTFGANITF